jgi:F0F1-type ATP synthase epsilon subunit
MRRKFQDFSKVWPASIVILSEDGICKQRDAVLGSLFAREGTMGVAASHAPIVNWFQSGAGAALCSIPNTARPSVSGGLVKRACKSVEQEQGQEKGPH